MASPGDRSDEDLAARSRPGAARRGFLQTAAGAAAAPFVSGFPGLARAVATSEPTPVPERRRLGSLEVSSLGLGVQNMGCTYQTTIPNRAEMIRIIRAAFDRGVTFFDASEAYGPHEVERILGDVIAPFRDRVEMSHPLENLGAVDVRLAPEEWIELEAAAMAIRVQGARLPDRVLAFSDVEAPARH